jgi:putative copper export protein
MIALGFFNRFRLAPRLAPGASALAPLRNEVALKTVVVALVSAFALLDPR